MRAWQISALVVLGITAAAIVIPAEREARRLREQERKDARAQELRAWRAHWERVRPRAWHELPILESPSIVPEMSEVHLDTS